MSRKISELTPERQEDIRARNRAATARYRSRNPEKVKKMYREWREANPEKRRAINKKYQHANLEKIRDKSKRWRLENPEMSRLSSRRWAKNNPEKDRSYKRNGKAKRRGAPGSHTAAEVRKLLKHQKCKCAACKANIKNGYHEDHVVPIIRGGTNYISNIQLLCPACNLIKGGKDPIVFMQEMGYLL